MKYTVNLRGPVIPDPFGMDATVISEAFIRNSLPIDKLTEKDTVLFNINSPGGSVTEGFSIFNLIANLKARKEFYIEGLCASIASLIILAGDNVRSSDVMLGMIHRAQSMPGFESKTGDELRQEAEILDRVDNVLISMYLKRNEERGTKKLTQPDLEKMLTDETWMDAYEMKEYGFIDEVEETEMAANVAAYVGINNLLNQNNPSMKHLEKLRKLFNSSTATVTPETVKSALVQALGGKKISALDEAGKVSLPTTIKANPIFATISKEDSDALTTAITEAIKSMTEEEIEEEKIKKEEEETEASAKIEELNAQVSTIGAAVMEMADAVNELTKTVNAQAEKLVAVQKGVRTTGGRTIGAQALAGQQNIAGGGYVDKFAKHREEMKAITEKNKAEREARMGQKAFQVR